MISDPQSLYQLPKGTLLKDRYQIDSVLGQGGFGITYKGQDLMLEMTVAVKEFFPHGYAIRGTGSSFSVILSTGHELFDKWRERFLTEARTLAKCSDVPAIVQVRDFFEENNTAYIVMEYLSGISLQDHLRRVGAVPADKMFSYMIPLIRDLDHVHKLGLIHRDISPDNIMLMPDDSLKLFDFGAARKYSDDDPRTLSIMLKPGYAPEEQYRKKGVQGPWTDVYAICATIYKCITGVTPPDSVERLNKDELAAPSELGCHICADMEQILLKGMNIHGEDRFQDAASLADEMEKSMPDAKNVSSPVSVTRLMCDADEASDERNTYTAVLQDQMKMSEHISDSADINDKTVVSDNDNRHPSAHINKHRLLWICIAAAVVALVCVIIILSSQRPLEQTKKAAKTTAQQEMDTVYRMTDGTYEPVSDNTLLNSVFWGIHSFDGEDFLAVSKDFMDISTDSGSLNISEFPVAFLINPAWKDEPLICLCFIDQFRYMYFVFAAYSLDGDVLRLGTPAYPESVPQLNPSDIIELAPALYDEHYICEEGTSYPEEGRAYLLDDEISWSFKLTNTASGKVSFNNGTHSIIYQSGNVNNGGSRNLILNLQGCASDSERAYKEMEGLDLLYDPDRGETAATVYYTDGGRSLDAQVTYYYESLGIIDIKTKKTERLYNGRIETFDDKSTLRFTYINTYPYGFIIYEKLQGEDCYYYYQKPLETAR